MTTFQKSWRAYHETIACNKTLHNFGSKWAQIARFRGKLTNVTIAYLLCLIMLKLNKKISMTDHEI